LPPSTAFETRIINARSPRLFFCSRRFFFLSRSSGPFPSRYGARNKKLHVPLVAFVFSPISPPISRGHEKEKEQIIYADGPGDSIINSKIVRSESVLKTTDSYYLITDIHGGTRCDAKKPIAVLIEN